MRSVILCSLLMLVLSSDSIITSAQGNTPIQGTKYHNATPSAEAWANRGLELFQLGDFEKAIEYLTEAWKLNPDNSNRYIETLSNAHNNLAQEYLTQREYAQALKALRLAIFYNQDNKTASENLDLTHQILQNQPKNIEYRLAEARKLKISGYLEEAIAEYQRVLELGNNNQTKLELSQVYQVLYTKYQESPVKQVFFKKLTELITDISKAEPNNPKPHIILGRAYYSAGSLAKAISSYENALTLDPDNKQAQNDLVEAWAKVIEIAPDKKNNLIGYGNALIRAGRTEKGERYLQKAESGKLKKDKAHLPQNINDKGQDNYSLLSQAISAHRRKNYERAITLYKQAIDKMPPSMQSSDIYYNLALAYYNSREYHQTNLSLHNALKINPQNKEAKSFMKLFKREMTDRKAKYTQNAQQNYQNEEYQETISIYKQALKEMPEEASLHYNLGVTYQAIHQPKLAEQEYRLAVKYAPENEEYQKAYNAIAQAMEGGYGNVAESERYLEQAVTLQSSGKIKEAILKYNQAIKSHPQNASAHFNLATAYHSQGKRESALREYQISLNLAPNIYPEARYFLGRLYQESSDIPRALQEYRLYLESHPHGDYAEYARDRINVINSVRN